MKNSITADELRKLMHYDPITGEFRWLVQPSRSVKAGDLAGNINKIGYVTIGIRGDIFKAHRLAWLYVTGEWPQGLMDHINGNKSDNRFENLRDISTRGNSENVHRPQKNNKSGFIGVCPFRGKWRASIKIDKEYHWLGDYSTPEEAHAAYLGAKRIFHAACTI